MLKCVYSDRSSHPWVRRRVMLDTAGHPASPLARAIAAERPCPVLRSSALALARDPGRDMNASAAIARVSGLARWPPVSGTKGVALVEHCSESLHTYLIICRYTSQSSCRSFTWYWRPPPPAIGRCRHTAGGPHALMVHHLPARRQCCAPEPDTPPPAMQPSSQRQRARHAASAAWPERAAPRGWRRREPGHGDPNPTQTLRADQHTPRRGRCASWCCRAPRGCWRARGTRPAGGRRARRPPCCRTRPRTCRPRTPRCRRVHLLENVSPKKKVA